MKRMTERDASGHCTIAGDLTPTDRTLLIPSALDRLAAYEDTGLEPEEIMRLIHGAVSQEICGCTGVPCCHCQPGPCQHRLE